ncbi:MAG: type II toxin-antitoxin system death-on-curing family toxin [Methylotenera sp.]|nr:type II toxin-antitoxin system death-on-curing family toxin [Methylotenera sp.]MDO9233177.1 type II toxin-antitoxin system death-on-curing family toxin [Methylotenera sp.]MDO9389671.1 type II toxin-antitoxin system death-on-curing family toxin [Methylotenera sp.]MDP2100991.1 type II toxin-antitoxin system death-on-curing family toxin [Methylotenera sp.]MDP2281824.1 type II toxin-antitoxin system death-on-curing family toxin [Methylotenera sp.]
MTRHWLWLDATILYAVHDEQLVEHGGISGVRDIGMFESALSRAPNLAAYGEPDFAELAAAYGFGLAKNHPFLDGNKRTAFVAVELFLRLNGYVLSADDSTCILTMLALAAGDIDEANFASWIRQNSAQR